MIRMFKRTHLIVVLTLAFAAAGAALAESASSNAGNVTEVRRLGEAVERQLPPDGLYRRWVHDADTYAEPVGDRIELREVVQERVRTVKVRDLVPPIPFDSGDAAIRERYVGLLRDVLERMKDRQNVRLHFIGHTDDAPLLPSLAAIYGDNTELSRERAGTTA